MPYFGTDMAKMLQNIQGREAIDVAFKRMDQDGDKHLSSEEVTSNMCPQRHTNLT